MKQIDYLEALNMLARLNEGGSISPSYRSHLSVKKEELPKEYKTDRSLCSIIYYYLEPDEISRWHRLQSDEVWMWRAGGSLELTLGGKKDAPQAEKTILLGPNLYGGEQLDYCIEAHMWQTAKPLGETGVLVSCVVTPGFEEADYEEWIG